MIKIDKLTHKYKDNKALEDVSFEIQMGVTGLLGENGAGKTTLMNILCTILKKELGTVEIDGLEVEKSNYKEIRNLIGYMPQHFDFYKSFTVYEVLEYLSIMNELDKSYYQNRISTLLDELNLKDKENVKTKGLSGGMKRRLGLACAIINEPKYLIVDEPTVGLDPKERIKMRNYIKNYAKDKFVLLSSHIVEDVQNITNKLVIISKGKIIYDGDASELIASSPKTYRLECNENDVEQYEKLGAVTNMEFVENTVFIRLITDETLDTKGCETLQTTLEDAYMYLLNNREV